MKNITAFLTGPEKIELRETPMPTVGEDDVLVKVARNGICGSDLNLFHDPSEWPLPIVLGHECSGYVADVGKNVHHVKEGDAVALEPGVPCGQCKYCLSGRYNICPDVIFMAAPPFATGSLCTYVAHPGIWTFRLEEGMDIVQGALMEPLSVGMYAATKAGAGLGQRIAILGCGCIGMMTLMVCRSMGASDITMVDIYDSRLESAAALGATHVINSRRVDAKAGIVDYTQGEGCDMVFETAGSPVTAALTTSIVARGGKIVMVGNIHGKVPFDFLEINNKEADVLSIFRYRNMYPMLIQAVSEKKIPVMDIMSRTFDFEHCQEAFHCAHHEKEKNLKIMIAHD